jgi:cyanophycinase-like exopeptidase
MLEPAIARADRDGGRRRVRVRVVPTAAARSRPDLAAANGVRTFGRVGAADFPGTVLDVAPVALVAAADAADPAIVAALGEADLIHFPGGDPDLIPTILPGTPAWHAIEGAFGGGAVLAGASAGAMALGGWTWTPDGGLPGLGIVPDLVIAPHATAASWDDAARRWGSHLPVGMSALGLEERTAVVIEEGRPWRIVGEGEARWLRAGTSAPIVYLDGDTFSP